MSHVPSLTINMQNFVQLNKSRKEIIRIHQGTKKMTSRFLLKCDIIINMYICVHSVDHLIEIIFAKCHDSTTAPYMNDNEIVANISSKTYLP